MVSRRQQRSHYFNACGNKTSYKSKDAARPFLMERRLKAPEFRWAIRSCKWSTTMTRQGVEHFHVRVVGTRTPEQVADVLAHRVAKAAQIAAQGFFTTRGRSGGRNGSRKRVRELGPHGLRQQFAGTGSTGDGTAETDRQRRQRKPKKNAANGVDGRDHQSSGGRATRKGGRTDGGSA